MIKHPTGFNSALPAGFDGVFDWDFLLPAFEGTKITPMDLDCIIERHGYFLVFETKQSGVEIPQGQKITLKTLVNAYPCVVVILRAKTAADITGWEVWKLKDKQFDMEYFEGDAVMLLAQVKRWFEWASKRWAA